MSNYEYKLYLCQNEFGKIPKASDIEEIGSYDSIEEAFDAMLNERHREFEKAVAYHEDVVDSGIAITRFYDENKNRVGEVRATTKLTYDYPYMRKFDVIMDYVAGIEYHYATYKLEKEVNNE